MDLQENDIKTAGLMALSLALRVNENITRLDVDRETKKESVCTCFYTAKQLTTSIFIHILMFKVIITTVLNPYVK